MGLRRLHWGEMIAGHHEEGDCVDDSDDGDERK